MVSSMEEFFRTVSVSQLFSLTPRCGFSPSIDENIFDYTEIDWESVEIRNDCCSIARSGCVQRGQPTPTQRTPTVTCEAKKFSDFHEDKIFFRYEPVLYDYIWHRAHGRNMIWTNIFDVCSPSIPSHLVSCFDIKIGRDLILVFETLICIARFLSWSGRSFSAQKITNRQR